MRTFKIRTSETKSFEFQFQNLTYFDRFWLTFDPLLTHSFEQQQNEMGPRRRVRCIYYVHAMTIVMTETTNYARKTEMETARRKWKRQDGVGAFFSLFCFAFVCPTSPNLQSMYYLVPFCMIAIWSFTISLLFGSSSICVIVCGIFIHLVRCTLVSTALALEACIVSMYTYVYRLRVSLCRA